MERMGSAEDDFPSYEPGHDKGVDEREEIMLSITQEWLFSGALGAIWRYI